MSINWFPGHMHKATKEIRQILPKIDVIIEVLDARIPYSSANPVINQIREDKPCIKLLNKMDLADPEITQQWIEHFEQQQGVKAMQVSMHQPERIRAIADLAKKLAGDKESALGNINAMIMGIPNVDKSTIINILAGKTIAETGNVPAVTKRQQKINLQNGVILFDTPGILWPKVENEHSGYRLAVTGAIRDTAIRHDDVGFFAAEYLLHAYPELLKKRYQLEDLPATVLEFMEAIGRRRGSLGAGGLVDLDKISKILLNEYRDSTLGAITLETPAMAVREEVEVQEKIAKKAAEKEAKKQQRKKDFKNKQRKPKR